MIQTHLCDLRVEFGNGLWEIEEIIYRVKACSHDAICIIRFYCAIMLKKG